MREALAPAVRARYNGARAIPTPAGGRIPPRPVGDKGGRRPSEPQSIERGSVLCDNGELRRRDGSAGMDMQRGLRNRSIPLLVLFLISFILFSFTYLICQI